MTETITITRKQYAATDPRLGRHVLHDSRSLNFQVDAAPIDSLPNAKWQHYIPVLDQGSLGSCTGNAATGCLGAGEFWDTVKDKNLLASTDGQLDEQFAVGVYGDATKLDPWPGAYPPQDTGSDGLSVAKVLLSRGLISGYQHATSLEAALTALSKQPVIVGTEWLNDMFRPDADGRLHLSGSVAGGHEYLLDELDVTNKRIWMCNSWNTQWGLSGRAYFTYDDFAKLLTAQGDCTVFVPITKPAPTPTPPTPTPPTPEDPKAEFAKAAANFEVALHKYLDS